MLETAPNVFLAGVCVGWGTQEPEEGGLVRRGAFCPFTMKMSRCDPFSPFVPPSFS